MDECHIVLYYLLQTVSRAIVKKEDCCHTANIFKLHVNPKTQKEHETP
jgi:hypothetical protein